MTKYDQLYFIIDVIHVAKERITKRQGVDNEVQSANSMLEGITLQNWLEKITNPSNNINGLLLCPSVYIHNRDRKIKPMIKKMLNFKQIISLKKANNARHAKKNFVAKVKFIKGGFKANIG
jgi:hypothetical protein